MKIIFFFAGRTRFSKNKTKKLDQFLSQKRERAAKIGSESDSPANCNLPTRSHNKLPEFMVSIPASKLLIHMLGGCVSGQAEDPVLKQPHFGICNLRWKSEARLGLIGNVAVAPSSSYLDLPDYDLGDGCGAMAFPASLWHGRDSSLPGALYVHQ